MDDRKQAEVIDVTALAGKFKNRAELQKYCEMLFQSFKSAVQKLQAAEEENKHLKELLSKSVAVIQPTAVKLNIPDEQAIAEMQLQRLKLIAMERELTLDETKRFDLLTKNLYLSKGKPTSVINTKGKRLEEDMSEAELVQLAKKDNE